MAYRVIRSTATDLDLDFILDFLVGAYRDFGDPVEDAFERAAARIRGIEADMKAVGEMPRQGTLMQEIMAGLRHVTKNHAILYFNIDEGEKVVRILAVFIGSQDHRRHMLRRLMSRFDEE